VASGARAQRRGTLREGSVELLLLLRPHWQGLTPELSRPARCGSARPRPRSGLGLNELLGATGNFRKGGAASGTEPVVVGDWVTILASHILEEPRLPAQ